MDTDTGACEGSAAALRLRRIRAARSVPSGGPCELRSPVPPSGTSHAEPAGTMITTTKMMGTDYKRMDTEEEDVGCGTMPRAYVGRADVRTSGPAAL